MSAAPRPNERRPRELRQEHPGTADRTPSKVIRTLQAIGPATAVPMGLTAAVYAACATVTALTGGPLP